jgi:hypothetical protein
VAQDGGVGEACFGARLAHPVAPRVVGIGRAATVVGDGAQAPNAKGAARCRVPGVGDVLAPGGVGHRTHAIECVVAACLGNAACIGQGAQVASCIKRGIERTVVGRDFPTHVAQTINGEGGGGIVGRAQPGELVAGVVAQAGQARDRVGDLACAVQRVKLRVGALAFGVGCDTRVAVGVLSVLRHEVHAGARIGAALLPAEHIKAADGAARHGTTRVGPRGFCDVAQVVSGEVGAAPGQVADADEALCGVVAVAGLAAVGTGDAEQLPHRITLVLGGEPGDAAREQPAALVPGAGHGHAVGVAQRQRAAMNFACQSRERRRSAQRPWFRRLSRWAC